MGTRSLTVFEDDDKTEIVVMYRQMDGYPEGHGKDLAEFLSNMVITNGILLGDKRKTANGMGCLAAQVIAHFKKETGGFYLLPAGARNSGEEWVYIIWPGILKDAAVGNVAITVVNVHADDEKTWFEGTPEDLLKKIQ